MISWKHSASSDSSETDGEKTGSKVKEVFSSNPAYAIAWGKSLQVKCVARRNNAKSNKNIKPELILSMDFSDKIVHIGWLENKVRFNVL
jgi:hypothetical protein